MVGSSCGWCVIFYLSFNFVYSASKTGCALSVLNNAQEKYVPVMLHNRSSEVTLIVPAQGQIHLKNGEGILFVCPEKNYLVPTNSNSTCATCVEGTTLKIHQNIYNFNEIVCKKPIRGGIQITNARCGNKNGEVINIGYRITQRIFIELISVCYDKHKGRALYSEHVIHGEEVAYTSKFSGRPSFSTEGLAKDVAANIAYKRPYQKSTVSSLLRGSRVADQYIDSKSYLSRGHLSPDADFLFASSQLASYFYINTCPQWQIINGGNWVRVESAVRKVAGKYRRNFIVVTGTHGVLELPDVNNNPTEIYLVSGKKLPVPKFVWKVMFDKKFERGIAFISLNNPFVKEITKEDLLCENICKQYGWENDYFYDLSRGYIYCCDVNELKEVVDTIPNFKINGVLKSNL